VFCLHDEACSALTETSAVMSVACVGVHFTQIVGVIVVGIAFKVAPWNKILWQQIGQ
jgi:hypothetical protein